MLSLFCTIAGWFRPLCAKLCSEPFQNNMFAFIMNKFVCCFRLKVNQIHFEALLVVGSGPKCRATCGWRRLMDWRLEAFSQLIKLREFDWIWGLISRELLGIESPDFSAHSQLVRANWLTLCLNGFGFRFRCIRLASDSVRWNHPEFTILEAFSPWFLNGAQLSHFLSNSIRNSSPTGKPHKSVTGTRCGSTKSRKTPSAMLLQC